ncbi:hypothetical protein N9977_00105 [bacterium]|nr:hypothetical protein [bacterium]
MSLPAGRGVQRFQQGGFSWGQAFNFVRGLLGETVQSIANSVVTVGLPALIMGASPKDALKYSAATGIASLAGQKLMGSPNQQQQVGGGSQQQAALTPEEIETFTEQMRTQNVVPQGTEVTADPNTGEQTLQSYTTEQLQDFKSQLTPVVGQKDTRGFFEALGDGDLKQAFLPDTAAFEDKKDYIRQYGPLLGLGIGGLWAAGKFDPPDPLPAPDPFGGQTSQGLMRANPSAYRSAPTFVPRGADGGLAQSYPRRNGSINGPGTGTSDEIPAMLSDGEFVMTAQAVKGAGNGSREKGMSRMYDAMHRLEGAA